jgi:hypothetical protein
VRLAWWNDPAYKTCNTFHLRGLFIFDKLKQQDAARFAELLSDLYPDDRPDPQDIGKFRVAKHARVHGGQRRGDQGRAEADGAGR